ncbi:conserved hypothetical protein [Culex quinquefasciatus]|uniref:MD-2-related lipid-recognition domain-containing protein n=1 Tax=Culex quinquefasciatus TaxID=7176 RepID=B0WTI4_CULQU|nr:conserved hypothetical protein [Culex quinquefasciatus]|eukprot:XP_001854116.1 conserved hypothetical protein [Culex quinquefasciatus]
MVAKASLLLLLVISIATVKSVQVMLEQLNHCTSNGGLDCNLRVRKLNRTVAAMYGNVTLQVDLGNNFLTSFGLSYSRLGNNQFNLYPFRIVPVGFCTFMSKFWGDYYPYFVRSVPQLERPGVCPVTARLLRVNDLVLDSTLFPNYMSPGLWKLQWRGTDIVAGKHFAMEVVFKVYPNGYF